MANFRNGTLYVGVTNNLLRRVWWHKNNVSDGFTSKYGLHLLVHYELFETMEQAILREKQIKSGTGKRKLLLTETKNPKWIDLYSDLI